MYLFAELLLSTAFQIIKKHSIKAMTGQTDQQIHGARQICRKNV